MYRTPNPAFTVEVEIPMSRRARKVQPHPKYLKPESGASPSSSRSQSMQSQSSNSAMSLDISADEHVEDTPRRSAASSTPLASLTARKKRPSRPSSPPARLKGSRLGKRVSSSASSDESSSLSSAPASPQVSLKRTKQPLRKRPSTSGDPDKTPSKRRKVAHASVTNLRGGPSPVRRTASAPEVLSKPGGYPFGSLVGIKLDKAGAVVLDQEALGIWWPAKVIGTLGELRISLLGSKFPGGNTDPIRRLADPRPHNILHFRQGDIIQLDPARFIEPSPNEDGPDSSASELHAAWKSPFDAAFTLALSLDQADNDGLPDADFLELSQPMSRTPTRGSDSRGQETEDEDDDDSEGPIRPQWTPDPTVTTGTGVLALDRTRFYWPAKVLSIEYPIRKGEGKYRVLYSDLSQRSIVRSAFYTSYEEGFLTCRLGELKEIRGAREAPDERETPVPRSPSPEPVVTAPTENDFLEADYRQQVGFIRPILEKILDKDYPCALIRHDKFVAGGKQRASLSMMAHRGDLSDGQVSDILQDLRRWALRSERWGPVNDVVDEGFDHATTLSRQYPRRKGCADYEALNESERSQYIFDVLLPEALIQLHALRRGMRNGPLPLDDLEAEQALYDKASASLQDEVPALAWADQILATRQAFRASAKMKPEVPHDKGKPEPVLGSTRSRRQFKA